MKILILILFPLSIIAQDIGSYKFFISFKDKGTYSIDDFQLSDLVSQKAIDRREKQSIDIHYSDLPVFSDYKDSISQIGYDVVYESKWLNGIICSSNEFDLSNISSLSFIEEIEYFGFFPVTISNSSRKQNKFEELSDNYGDAFNQIEMIQGHELHNLGYMGQEIDVAVLDAGFRNAIYVDGLKHLFQNNQILGTWDYVEQEESVYEDNYHGMSVLSTMASDLENQFVGMSPKANYWLLRTENSATENLIEEYYWSVAAEFCDSVGVDIINSSLGYTTFDLSTQDHSYVDLDGFTTPISKAATFAARKGMIVCSSAGNSGNSSWYYISAPADADSIITVGSVNQNRNVSSFTSRGPSADGRLKPTVSAQGGNTTIYNPNNTISTSNGTSFSSPIIAGMTACLWQANYENTAQEIISAIVESSHLVNDPNFDIGNGIPNFSIANAILKSEDVNTSFLEVYPNPVVNNTVTYLFVNSSSTSAKVYDLLGRLFYEKTLDDNIGLYQLNLPYLNNGTYLLSIESENSVLSKKIVVAD
jgi:subtilisin family serine protease